MALSDGVVAPFDSVKKIFVEGTSVHALMLRLTVVSLLQSKRPRSITVFGSVIHWSHDRGVGRVRLDAPCAVNATGTSAMCAREALVDRWALQNGFFLVEGQRIQAVPHVKAGSMSSTETPNNQPRLKLLRNEDGSLVRPRCLRGVVIEFNNILQTGIVAEVDLEGRLLMDVAPKYKFDAQDYECHHPLPHVGMRVLFHKEANSTAVGGAVTQSARRVVLDYKPKAASPEHGVVREVLEHHGFVEQDGTHERIYFASSSLTDPNIRVGDRVAFKLMEEPPVSPSAGKKLAISLTPL